MSALEQYFERRVLDLAAAAGRSYIVWQEILDNNVQVWIFQYVCPLVLLIYRPHNPWSWHSRELPQCSAS